MNNYSVDVKQIDLTMANSLKDIGIYDNIIINHYRLAEEQLANIENNLSDSGILFVCGFGHKHKIDNRIRKDDLIQPDDFQSMLKSFDLIEYIENKDERGFFVTYIFRKK